MNKKIEKIVITLLTIFIFWMLFKFLINLSNDVDLYKNEKKLNEQKFERLNEKINYLEGEEK